MKHLASLLLSILTAFAYSGFAYASNQLYTGNPSFEKLAPSVANTKLFINAPTPKVKHLNYQSHESSGGAYSYYQINPVKNKGFMTYYYTVEHVKEGFRFPSINKDAAAVVNGKGISFGGIFWPLELMTVKNKQGKIVYYNKIAITSMQPLSGHLFPLAVGNDLKFRFTRIHVRRIGNKTISKRDTGIMEYKVVAMDHNYPYSKTPVPGNVYKIYVLESTKNKPKYNITDEYYYAPKLGWYVTDKYFDNKKIYASYYLNSWS